MTVSIPLSLCWVIEAWTLTYATKSEASGIILTIVCACSVHLYIVSACSIGVTASFLQNIYTAQESGPVAVCARILNGSLDRSVQFSIQTADGSASCMEHK